MSVAYEHVLERRCRTGHVAAPACSGVNGAEPCLAPEERTGGHSPWIPGRAAPSGWSTVETPHRVIGTVLVPALEALS